MAAIVLGGAVPGDVAVAAARRPSRRPIAPPRAEHVNRSQVEVRGVLPAAAVQRHGRRHRQLLGPVDQSQAAAAGLQQQLEAIEPRTGGKAALDVLERATRDAGRDREVSLAQVASPASRPKEVSGFQASRLLSAHASSLSRWWLSSPVGKQICGPTATVARLVDAVFRALRHQARARVEPPRETVAA
jgi:hypothetical protein